MAETPEQGQRWYRVASTRPVQYRGDEFVTQFTRAALEDTAAQITATGSWMLVEHLEFLPPRGLTRTAEVRETADGEAELYLRAEFNLPTLTIEDGFEEFIAAMAAGLPSRDAPNLAVKIGYGRRNFTENDASIIEEESGGIALPVDRYSELPPLEFILTISVGGAAWALGAFFKSFFSQLGKAAGDALAKKIASWAKRSKDSDRNTVFSLAFVYPDGSQICGFVIAKPNEVEPRIDSALRAAGKLASIASLHHEKNIFSGIGKVAFFLENDEWRLGWWTDGKRVITTKWFSENPPDSEGVLGRTPPWEMGAPPPEEEDETV